MSETYLLFLACVAGTESVIALGVLVYVMIEDTFFK